jgi:hypothetical protein
MMSKSKSVARKIIVPSGQLSAGGHTRGRTSQISSTSSWPTMQRRAPSVEERRVRGSRRKDAPRATAPRFELWSLAAMMHGSEHRPVDLVVDGN